MTFAPFPHRPTIVAALRQELNKRVLLQGRKMGTLGIVDAEELLAIEGFAAKTGASVLDVVRGWKARAVTGDMHLKNMAVLKIAEPGDPAFRSVRLAPLYDTLCARLATGTAANTGSSSAGSR